MVFPIPSTGLPRPDGAPELSGNPRPTTGHGHNTPTDQAKHVYSTHQTEDKARQLSAGLTGMHVKYRESFRQALFGGVIRSAEATYLGPFAVNCIRSGLDAQEALVEAVMTDLQELASSGSPSAETTLDFEIQIARLA